MVSFDISQPEVLIGLIVGGMMVYLFAALAIKAVGRTSSSMVEEVRQPVPGEPGDHGAAPSPPGLRAAAVAIVTAAAQREMILPSLIPIVVAGRWSASCATRRSAAC